LTSTATGKVDLPKTGAANGSRHLSFVMLLLLQSSWCQWSQRAVPLKRALTNSPPGNC